MHNCLKVIILLVTVTFSFVVSAQINFKKGYIITNGNDTVYGRINDGGATRNAKVCLFKEDKGKKLVKYHPGDIMAYRIIGDKHYVSREVNKNGLPVPTFLEVLIDGKVKLYHYLKGRKTSFYIEKQASDQLVGLTNEKLSELFKPLPDTPVSYSKNYYLTNTAYLDTLSSLFRDDQKIQTKIINVGYYRKSLMTITKQYIKDVCAEEDCITYEKQIIPYRPRFGLFTGHQVSQVSFYPVDNQSQRIMTNSIISNPMGAFINFPLPIRYQGFSVQFEFVDHRIHYTQNFTSPYIRGIELNATALTFPISLKYELAREKFTPSISIGFENNYIRSAGWRREPGDRGGFFGDIGLDYKIYKKLSVFANLRVESRNHNLEQNLDNVVRYLNFDMGKERIIRGYTIAKTNFAAFYVGIRF